MRRRAKLTMRTHIDTSGDEPFPLYIEGTIVEKTVPSPFALIQRNKRITQLYERKMECSNARAGTTPTWSSGRKSWPTYLRSFAHKLWTKRLPTAYTRTRRGDTGDAEPVMPWCPHCLKDGNFTAETQEHLIQTFPRLTNSHFKLARTLNNIFRESDQPQAITPRLLEAEEIEHLENIGIFGTPHKVGCPTPMTKTGVKHWSAKAYKDGH